MRDGFLAELADRHALIAAASHMRALGYRQLDAFSPYPIIELEEAMGIRRSWLPWLILAGGIAGAATAYFFQWFLVAVLYPLNVGGRPAHMPAAFVPITFEMGVLFASFAAFFGALFFSRLPRLWDPVSDVDTFDRASIDGLWLRVGGDDPKFSAARTAQELRDVGALAVRRVGGRA